MDQKQPANGRAANDNAAELTRLAERAEHPGARAWYLQWAKAFRRLADLSGDRARDRDR